MRRKEYKKAPAFSCAIAVLLVYPETESCGIYREELQFLHIIHNQVPLPKKSDVPIIWY